MADLARLVERLGTPIVFGEAGGTVGGLAVTNTWSLDALAAGSARMSAEADLGADLPHELLFEPYGETGTAPTAATLVDFFAAFSRDGTNYPGGVTGSDGAWPSDGNEDEWKPQLGRRVASLVATNDGNVVQQQAPERRKPTGRYLALVCDNNLNVALRDEATASNNGSGMVVTPIYLYSIEP